jgi:hypothetical protein
VPEAKDNCDGSVRVTFSDSIANGSCPENYVITRTFTATDSCGNQATAVQVITVRDSLPPVISAPPDLVLSCGSSLETASTGNATASDVCDPNPTIIFADEIVNGDCPTVQTLTRTWTAIDRCGNSASAVQHIQVVDQQGPQLILPASLTLACDAPSSPSATGEAEATDNCDEGATITFADATVAGQCSQGDIVRTPKADRKRIGFLMIVVRFEPGPPRIGAATTTLVSRALRSCPPMPLPPKRRVSPLPRRLR